MKTIKILVFIGFFTFSANAIFAQTQATTLADLDDLEVGYSATGASMTMPDGTIVYEMAYASSKKTKSNGSATNPKYKCKGKNGSCSRGSAWVDTDGNIYVLSVVDMGQGAIEDATLYYQVVDGEVEETYE